MNSEGGLLWLGRFQPPTIAHFATLETILQISGFVTIGVVYNLPRPTYVDQRWDQYLAKGDSASFAPAKNPFKPHEVLTMWGASLRKQRLQRHVSVQATGRPQYDPDFKKRFAGSTLVMPSLSEDDAEIDHMRHALYPLLLGLNVRYVSPPFKLHNTEIRRRIASGTTTWREMIPAGAFEVFNGIDGPTRIFSSEVTE